MQIGDPTVGAAIVLGAIDFLGTGPPADAGTRSASPSTLRAARRSWRSGSSPGLVSGGNVPDGAPPTFVNHPLAPMMPLALNAWSEIVIEIDWGATSIEGKVSIDGSASAENKRAAHDDRRADHVTADRRRNERYVTTYDGGLSPVWEVRYDNVLFTAQ